MYDFSVPNEKPGVCAKCNGTGRYVSGPVVNGKPSKEGTCFSCRGTGKQDKNQIARNHTYNVHKLRTLGI